MSNPPAAPTHFDREHFHPLEIIPVFRRWPRSFVRDIVYTFIWSCLFGLFFYGMGAFTGGALPSLRAFGYNVLIANVIGYSIHFLFSAGAWARLDLLAKRSGFIAKVVYFSTIPLAGVVLGLWISSLVFDVRLKGMFTDLNALLSMAFVSLVISFVLSVIFFWRERSAVAEAARSREREHVERMEREALSANLRALQAQIEPHFLFNTLANVTSLIDSDPAKARHMLESFIRFLRSSLAATRGDRTTLGDDFALIADFLNVIQVRMGERLAVRMEIPDGLRAFELPPLLLQPIVENAIRHGLEPKVEGGTIALTASERDGRVVIEVADTGVGFMETTSGGIGLANIRDRLKLQYGDDAKLAIRDNPPMGTRVTIELPGAMP
jgi:sensor histidine kinase YesM